VNSPSSSSDSVKSTTTAADLAARLTTHSTRLAFTRFWEHNCNSSTVTMHMLHELLLSVQVLFIPYECQDAKNFCTVGRLQREPMCPYNLAANVYGKSWEFSKLCLPVSFQLQPVPTDSDLYMFSKHALIL
jgi:hypothetical protein